MTRQSKAEYQRKYRARKAAEKAETRASAEKERRDKLTPFQLGMEDGFDHYVAVARYNAKPGIICPFAKGSPEEANYDNGWKTGVNRAEAFDRSPFDC